MTKTCPECGSTDIVSELLVFADKMLSGDYPPSVKLIEPDPEKLPFIWSPKIAATGFRAAVCGACGYTRFYAANHAEILAAHQKGYTSQQYALKNILSV
jgi:predicted nucleic-acid-binding Zn-ribbon protein